MTVTIIGTGRVASSLINILSVKGFLYGVYGRDERTLDSVLSAHKKIKALTSLDFTDNPSTIYLLAISDDSIESVACQVRLPSHAILAHTSGTRPMDALGDLDDRGVFYPLQTFTLDDPVDFSEVPLLIEASNSYAEENLLKLAHELGHRVQIADSQKRKMIHVSAVYASNFTNRMLYAAERILKNSQMDLSLLEPLVYQSISNVFKNGAQKSLTGPALREDTDTIKEHMSKLEGDKELAELYLFMTDFIIQSKKGS